MRLAPFLLRGNIWGTIFFSNPWRSKAFVGSSPKLIHILGPNSVGGASQAGDLGRQTAGAAATREGHRRQASNGCPRRQPTSENRGWDSVPPGSRSSVRRFFDFPVRNADPALRTSKAYPGVAGAPLPQLQLGNASPLPAPLGHRGPGNFPGLEVGRRLRNDCCLEKLLRWPSIGRAAVPGRRGKMAGTEARPTGSELLFMVLRVPQAHE